MDPVGESWSALASSAPDIADAGRRLLAEDSGTPGVAFLGTVGVDGMPRIHPFIPAVLDGSLWAFVIESPKQRDLDRTRRFAVHSLLGPKDESFYCAGSSRRVADQAIRSTVGAAMPFSDIDDHHFLYELRLVRALWTTWTTPTSPVHRKWATRDA